MLVYDWYSGRLIILSPDPFHPLGLFRGGIETLGAVNCGFAVALGPGSRNPEVGNFGPFSRRKTAQLVQKGDKWA